MARWHRVLLGSLLLLLLTVNATACGKSPQEALLGTWRLTNDDTLLQFDADGTLTTTVDGTTYEGTYRFVDNTHIDVEIAPEVFGTATFVAETDIRYNQMAFTGQFNPNSLPFTMMFERVVGSSE